MDVLGEKNSFIRNEKEMKSKNISRNDELENGIVQQQQLFPTALWRVMNLNPTRGWTLK